MTCVILYPRRKTYRLGSNPMSRNLLSWLKVIRKEFSRLSQTFSTMLSNSPKKAKLWLFWMKKMVRRWSASGTLAAVLLLKFIPIYSPNLLPSQKEAQDLDFFLQRISLKHTVGKYGQKTIAMAEEPRLLSASRHRCMILTEAMTNEKR